jgi:XTP/dITP diphosphohydrolase
MDGVRAVLCSRNRHKARELETLMPGWEIVPLLVDDYPPETGATYYENARSKAEFGRARADADAWTLGEDSGLEVESLGGRPGIESARYAPEGAPAIAKLLGELAGVDARRARYVSELVAIAPDGREVRGTGFLTGEIAAGPRGSEGFGYDPVFVPDGEVQTVAELGNAWKSHNSHRARAVRALLAALGAASMLVVSGCGTNQRAQHRVLDAFFARSKQARALGTHFPHKPGTLVCGTSTCSTDISLVKPNRAVITLTQAWNHGARAHTWFFFVRRDGAVESVVQEGPPPPSG